MTYLCHGVQMLLNLDENDIPDVVKKVSSCFPHLMAKSAASHVKKATVLAENVMTLFMWLHPL